MNTYYYETHKSLSTRKIAAENDEEAITKLKEMFGENLLGVMIVYTEEYKDEIRTVWME